jgi:hypothetical protein
MTIKEDFYEIVGEQDYIMDEKITDGIKTYLEKLGFNTDVIDFNIVIEMHVDSDRIREYKEKSSEFLSSYYELLDVELDSSWNDEEVKETYQKELDELTEFLDEYN